MQAAFSGLIDQNTWMEDDTKKVAQDKLTAIVQQIGYPDSWDNFADVTLVVGELYDNYDKLVQRQFQKGVIDKVGNPVDRSEWLMAPAVVNAYYNPPANSITFPAGILQVRGNALRTSQC